LQILIKKPSRLFTKVIHKFVNKKFEYYPNPSSTNKCWN